MKIHTLWMKVACTIGEVSKAKTVKKKLNKNTFNVTAKDIEISYVATRKAIIGLEENGLLVHKCGDKCMACELLKWVEKQSSFDK